MLRSPHFYVGAAAGVLLAWLIAGRSGRLVTGRPVFPRPIRRTPRRGARWYGRPRDSRDRHEAV